MGVYVNGKFSTQFFPNNEQERYLFEEGLGISGVDAAAEPTQAEYWWARERVIDFQYAPKRMDWLRYKLERKQPLTPREQVWHQWYFPN